MINNLSKTNSVANQFIAELRDVNIQKDRMRFRFNLERMGEILAYEISKSFSYSEKEVETPLGVSIEQLPLQQPIIAAILRAGLPMHQGMLRIFDHSDNAFICAYRKHHKGGNFEIKMEYVSTPDLTDRCVILCDPMLATGSSIVKTYEALMEHGKPSAVHIATVIASQDGINYVRRLLPDVHLWCGAIDEELTARSYIVPGLGDAGDLAYGDKLQE